MALTATRENVLIEMMNTLETSPVPNQRIEIGIHAIRMGNIVGVHEVMIGTQNERITLKHEAQDRALFAEGALSAARFLLGKAPGLYTMKDMVNV